jgi:hypothetical protein
MRESKLLTRVEQLSENKARFFDRVKEGFEKKVRF